MLNTTANILLDLRAPKKLGKSTFATLLPDVGLSLSSTRRKHVGGIDDGAAIASETFGSGSGGDISIVASEDRPNGGLRARVSVVVQTYPDRNVRSMLNGAATVMGASGDSARQQAIEGALRGALRGLPQAMEASAATARSSRPAKRRRRRRR